MSINNILGREGRETALVLGTDQFARIAQNPIARGIAEELGRLSAKVTELASA
ncbi:hypothetical protein PVW53_06650 [Seohaeicola sp. SP36]|uniref:hypothetical protein n=1 Tax=unclassified Seohaeicola TaxID=2641111 RepID=UPI00237B5550|nr:MULTISPECIES: hypothetical protein [unclassified Seohaeicola]MDD9706958.1 hypothetical protein [Seohaeicola sp. 4SK31]MDD9735194.1 hypothetical protein [Seohaeicola sp. SP36]